MSDSPQLLIRAIVDNADGVEVVNYVFDLNDYAQRRVFAEQMTNVYLGGQVATTYAENWTPSAQLKAFMARRWFLEHEAESPE